MFKQHLADGATSIRAGESVWDDGKRLLLQQCSEHSLRAAVEAALSDGERELDACPDPELLRDLVVLDSRLDEVDFYCERGRKRLARTHLERSVLALSPGQPRQEFLRDVLKEMRTRAGLTQSELATSMGCTGASIGHVETGRAGARLDVAVDWANACGYSLALVIVEEDQAVEDPELGKREAGDPSGGNAASRESRMLALPPAGYFGNWVRSKRQAVELTQTEVQKRAGLGGGYLAKVEKGRLVPKSLKRVEPLARILKADPNVLNLMAGRQRIAEDPQLRGAWEAEFRTSMPDGRIDGSAPAAPEQLVQNEKESIQAILGLPAVHRRRVLAIAAETAEMLSEAYEGGEHQT